jgi:hypothetical protein
MARQKSGPEEVGVRTGWAMLQRCIIAELIYLKVRSAGPTDLAVYAMATNSNRPT